MAGEFEPPKFPKVPSFEPPKVPSFEFPKFSSALDALARIDVPPRFPENPPLGPSPIGMLADIAEANCANEFCERLEAQFREFDESLDQDHEVGVRLVSYGQAVVFHVERIGYHNPSLIFFYGETLDGHRVQLIQHVSQIGFIMMAMKKPDPEKPRRPFGFAHRTPENPG